ncbi:MAG: glycosyltransferase [Flavobacteriales bacterium]
MDAQPMNLRVLLLSSKPAFPTLDGGCKATASMLQLLHEAGCHVDVLSLSTYKHPFSLSAFPRPWNRAERCIQLPVDTRFRPLDVAALLLSSSSYQVQRFRRFSRADLARVQSWLNDRRYDIVLWDSIYSMAIAEDLTFEGNPRQIARIHNVEHHISRFLHLPSWIQAVLKKEQKRLEAFELRCWKRVDEIWAMTREDADQVSTGVSTPVRCLAVPMQVEARDWPTAPLRFFHLGAMDWKPNVQGLEWLLAKVWPMVLAVRPEAELHLAGRAFPTEFAQGVSGVVVHGEVESAQDFTAQHHVLVVPVFEGSGIRIKTVEAALQGRMVISTSKGAAGLPDSVRSQIRLADTAEEMAQQMLDCLQNPSAAQAQAASLQQAMLTFAGWESALSTLSTFLRT